jgi:hypothetical protein
MVVGGSEGPKALSLVRVWTPLSTWAERPGVDFGHGRKAAKGAKAAKDFGFQNPLLPRVQAAANAF